tara:strand:+ start:1233 stop:1886 length:654 start_codon:yes stop_codon:yes gene_type:complete
MKTFFVLMFLILNIPNFTFSQEINSNIKVIDDSLVKFQKGVDAVKEKNYEIAADIFEELASLGDVDAQFNLAILTRNGLGRAQNYSDALYWTWLSFTGGLEKSEKVLEKILELVPEDSQQEISESVSSYILDQINSGNRKALMHYGKYYLDVLSDADYSKAYLFYSIASAFGEQGAKEKRDKVLDDIDNDRIVEIQSQASVMFDKLRKNEKIEMLKD